MRSLTPEERKAVKSTLSRLVKHGQGSRVADNIRRDLFLPTDEMKELLRYLGRLGDIATLSIADLLAAFHEECHKHVLMGGPITCNQPKTVGRAVFIPKYEKEISYYPLFNGSRRLARNFLHRLTKRGYCLSSNEAELPMSPHSAWVTWNPHDATTSTDPFHFVVHGSSYEIKSNLGLDPDLRAPVLLLTYDVPQDLELLRPTVADAGEYEFFSPPIFDFNFPAFQDGCCGRTHPWPAQFLDPMLRDPAPAPRPEAIHKSERMKCIKTPVRELP